MDCSVRMAVQTPGSRLRGILNTIIILNLNVRGVDDFKSDSLCSTHLPNNVCRMARRDVPVLGDQLTIGYVVTRCCYHEPTTHPQTDS